MQAITYSSAEDFLEDMKQTEFDCLVLDIQLPGLSRLELQEQPVAEGIATPNLFITAHDDPKATRAGACAGCAGFFRKTDSGSGILEAIRRVVGARLTSKSCRARQYSTSK